MGRPRKGKTQVKHIVYRYIDKTDGIIKYVGISREGALKHRIAVHKGKDHWSNKGAWRIEYFLCEYQSEAEAFEAHLIALYDTGKYYNKNKTKWGINQYLPSIENRWTLWKEDPFDDAETMRASRLFRWLLKNGYRDEAEKILECFVYED